MIAEALALAGGDLVALLGGPLGEQARAVKRASKRERAEMIARLRAPVPEGLRGVHASWIEAALAELPPRARVAVAAGGGDPVDVWLARWACAQIPPLPPIRAQRVRAIEDVIALPDPGEWLRAVGRAQLDYALSLAQPGAPRRDELGPARAVIARCRGGDELAIGARTLAPHTSPLQRIQLAVRLPRASNILGELHATARVADGPTFAVLASTHVAGNSSSHL
jgi:hypothetical protein